MCTDFLDCTFNVWIYLFATLFSNTVMQYVYNYIKYKMTIKFIYLFKVSRIFPMLFVTNLICS